MKACQCQAGDKAEHEIRNGHPRVLAHFSTAADADEFEVPIHHVELQDRGLKTKVGDTIAFVNPLLWQLR
jgi:hypothetical protein